MSSSSSAAATTSNHHTTAQQQNNTSSTNTTGLLSQQVSMALQTLKRLGINLLAIDFDQTIINVHTGGQWKGTARELARHVRPEFQELFHQVQELALLSSTTTAAAVAAAGIKGNDNADDDNDDENDAHQNSFSNNGLDICIVTFSPQVQLIRHVIEEGTTWKFMNDDHHDPSASNNNKKKNDRKKTTTTTTTPTLPLVIRGGDRSWFYAGVGSQDGKQPHMASAVEELESEHGRIITKQTTLLIDDDIKNVKCALHNGVRAIWFNPRRPQDLLPDMIRLV